MNLTYPLQTQFTVQTTVLRQVSILIHFRYFTDIGD